MSLQRRTHPALLLFSRRASLMGRFISLSLLAIPTICLGQAVTTSSVDFTRVVGAEDRDVLVPKPLLPLGRKDATALQAVIDFLKVTSVGPWSGMQANCTIATPGLRTGTSSDATLTVQGGNAFRLDVDTPQGQRSVRIQGILGQTLEGDGSSYLLPLATAKAGLFPLFKLFASTFPDANISVLEGGSVSVNGQALHRVTIEEPVFEGQTATVTDQASTVDLYFNPFTYLLVKSVAYVQVNPAHPARYIVVVNYSDYRAVGTALLPFAYSETLNGQRQWDLTLSAIRLNPSIDSSYFHF